MALIKCKECGKEISDQATTCPNCGAKTEISKKKRYNIIIAICIAVIAFIIILSVYFVYTNNPIYKYKQEAISILENYKNKKSLAKVQSERIGDYSDVIREVLEKYAEEIGDVVLRYNKTSTGKTIKTLFRVGTMKNRNISLDILRIIAALMVLSLHVGQQVGLNDVTSIGSRGVQLFFIMSGFWGMNSMDKIAARGGIPSIITWQE